MTARVGTSRIAVIAVVLLALLLTGQAAADRLAPVDGRSPTGAVMGRTGFAFLTGVRTYVAAVLWARLDPINDGYYETLALKDKKFLLPSIWMVTVLDPQFEQPFFIGPWLLHEAGQNENAYRLAREGVADNPRSGYLHASLAQLLVADGRFAEAAREADLALAGTWPSEADRFDMLTTLEIAYNKTGQTAKRDALRAEEARLRAKFDAQPAPSQ